MDMSEMDISDPLKPAVLHILLALADADRHGYAIMQAVREQSRGGVPLRTGSFYRHLSQLLDSGWVAEVKAPAGDDPRGRTALQAERARLVALLDAFPRRAARRSHS
jgi:DNA-binding PadR family transcriptional regulator